MHAAAPARHASAVSVCREAARTTSHVSRPWWKSRTSRHISGPSMRGQVPVDQRHFRRVVLEKKLESLGAFARRHDLERLVAAPLHASASVSRAAWLPCAMRSRTMLPLIGPPLRGRSGLLTTRVVRCPRASR